MEFKKKCPKCGKDQVYKHIKSYQKSIRKNTMCQSCTMTGKPSPHKGKKLPSPSAEVRKKISDANKGKIGSNKGKPVSQEIRDKISRSMKGRPAPNKGISPSLETRIKLSEKGRAATLRRLNRTGTAVPSNPLATHVFKGINRRMGWNGQHAGNGGEKQVCGYSLDYYVELPECILVIEWDEPCHLGPKAIAKDTIRQRRIEGYLGSRCIFLRWNQKESNWRDLVLSS